MDNNDNEKLTLTVPQAAQALGICRGTAYEAARRGELPTVRIGRRLLVPRAALERLLETVEQPGAEHR
ncbi:MAG: helix-turn-helix domain-containing protein [Dehalococcoidia bacterium]